MLWWSTLCNRTLLARLDLLTTDSLDRPAACWHTLQHELLFHLCSTPQLPFQHLQNILDEYNGRHQLCS